MKPKFVDGQQSAPSKNFDFEEEKFGMFDKCVWTIVSEGNRNFADDRKA